MWTPIAGPQELSSKRIPMTTSDQLKEAIRESGKTPDLIAKETGIAQTILSRFLSNDPDQHRDIRFESTADKLCAYFGLELRILRLLS